MCAKDQREAKKRGEISLANEQALLVRVRHFDFFQTGFDMIVLMSVSPLPSP